ncbi:pilus assembly protein PilP [Thiotrichales bacterium 19S11-10]|nr:pilus assembly protein PilP [Thiotrichales bacterium 19S11-10]MCF6807268.1 pilus assembly protein PilP [Thiotrichales bacterium 19S9-11]MCF6811237.1 pilus assembly protein PilP [Thiotrichales bacterium 19S9-12]
MKRIRPIKCALSFIYMLIISMFLVACEDHQQAVDQWIDNQQVKSSHLKVKPLPEIITFKTFAFKKANKDPFSVPILSANLQSPDGYDTKRIRTPLEKHALERLKLVGVINQGKKRWALIEITDTKRVYKVTDGDFIGNQFGQVKNITAKKINITEQIKTAQGKWKERQIDLKL